MTAAKGFRSVAPCRAGYSAHVSNFVMGLLVVQGLLGMYLFSFTTDAERPESNARRTRLPSPLLVVHPLIAGIGVIVWILWLTRGGDALPWVMLGILLVGGSIGSVLGIKTLRKAPDPVAVSPADPAEARLAEKRIPLPAIAAHGLVALTLIVCVLVVALGAN